MACMKKSQKKFKLSRLGILSSIVINVGLLQPVGQTQYKIKKRNQAQQVVSLPGQNPVAPGMQILCDGKHKE